MKYISKKPSSIPNLRKAGYSIDDDNCKAELLNECFAKNFTVPESPIDINRYSALEGESYPMDLLCTEEKGFDLISGIDPTKSSGSDQISARSGPMLTLTGLRMREISWRHDLNNQQVKVMITTV